MYGNGHDSVFFGTWFSFWHGNTPRHRWLPLMKRPKGMTVHLTECSVGCLCGGPGPPRRRCRCFGCTTTPAHAPVGQPSAPSFPAFCSFRRSVHNSRLRPWLTDPRVPNRLRFFFLLMKGLRCPLIANDQWATLPDAWRPIHRFSGSPSTFQRGGRSCTVFGKTFGAHFFPRRGLWHRPAAAVAGDRPFLPLTPLPYPHPAPLSPNSPHSPPLTPTPSPKSSRVNPVQASA